MNRLDLLCVRVLIVLATLIGRDWFNLVLYKRNPSVGLAGAQMYGMIGDWQFDGFDGSYSSRLRLWRNRYKWRRVPNEHLAYYGLAYPKLCA